MKANFRDKDSTDWMRAQPFKIKVKYCFASQFIGKAEVIAEFELPGDADVDKEIKSRSEEYLGIPWDDNCYYEILVGRLYVDFPHQSFSTNTYLNSSRHIVIREKED